MVSPPLTCPRCGGSLELTTEAYIDDGVHKISVGFVCTKCGTKFVLPLPLVEYRG